MTLKVAELVGCGEQSLSAIQAGIASQFLIPRPIRATVLVPVKVVALAPKSP